MKKTCIISLLFLLVASFTIISITNRTASAEDFSVTIPPADKILSTLKKSHPRLMVTEGSFSRVKRLTRENVLVNSWYRKLRSQAERLLKSPPSIYEIPDGKRLLSVSRRVLGRVYTLSLIYQLDNEKKFADRAWQELKAAAAFKDWNPSHFLDTAEMSHAFGIGYDWLFHVLTPAQRETIRNALIEKGLNRAIDSYEKKARFGWWVRSHHNWNQVCNGGICVGALAIADEKPELAGRILKHGLESFKLPVAKFAPDGAWAEGPGYWNYATAYHVYLLASLETALGTDFGFSKAPGFSETGYFPIDLTGPSMRTFNFADASAGTVRAPQLFWLSKHFNKPLFSWYEQKVARPHALDLVWFNPSAKSPTALKRSLAHYYRGPEVATFRSSWTDPNGLFLAFKAGDNRVNHSHLDIGTFVFEALGNRWAIDLGSDNYNMPGYFGSRRWTYYRLRSEGHNTLVLNPREGPSQDPRSSTRITRFSNDPDHMFAIADITSAYKGAAKKVVRGVALIDMRYVLIQDEITADKECNTWWFMHTNSKINLSKDSDGTAYLTQGNAILAAHLLSPSGKTFTVRKASPLPTSPNPSMQRKNLGVRKLSLNIKGKTIRIAVMLYPFKKGEREPGLLPEVIPLKKW